MELSYCQAVYCYQNTLSLTLQLKMILVNQLDIDGLNGFWGGSFAQILHCALAVVSGLSNTT